MITLKDEACHEILHFLKEIETYGKDIPAFISLQDDQNTNSSSDISQESRQLFMRLLD